MTENGFAAPANDPDRPAAPGPFTILFDGECPLCSREVDWLLRRNRAGRLRAVDISAPDFRPEWTGRTRAELMARIHGVREDGTLVEGVEVFRRAYAAVGLGWILAPTGWPGLRRLADAAYRVFARNRLRWTGRSHACADGSCALPESEGRR